MAFGSVNTFDTSGRETKALQTRVESLEKSLIGKEKLTGGTDPTEQTAAQVGQVYINTATGQEFVCTAATEEGTAWEERRQETSKIDVLGTRVERLEKALTGEETLTGSTDPTAQTQGQVGQTYLNTTTGKEFICIAATEEGTVWLEKLTGETDPTAQTTAQVGQVYLNTATGQEFVCIAVTEEGTVWEPRGTTQSGIPTVEVTQEEYDALSEEDKQGETLYVLPDGASGLELRYKGMVLTDGPDLVAGENVGLEQQEGKVVISVQTPFRELTQEEYDALEEKKPDILYLVTG